MNRREFFRGALSVAAFRSVPVPLRALVRAAPRRRVGWKVTWGSFRVSNNFIIRSVETGTAFR